MNAIKKNNRLYVDLDDLAYMLAEAQLRANGAKAPKSDSSTLSNVMNCLKSIKKAYNDDVDRIDGEVQELVLQEKVLINLI